MLSILISLLVAGLVRYVIYYFVGMFMKGHPPDGDLTGFGEI